MEDLGRLLAVQNDYILAEDEDEVVTLYQDLSFLITGDKEKGVNELMDYAEAAFEVRHPEYVARSSSPKMEVKSNV